ncbi:MAG: hypothetical protein WA383_00025 [Terriglobales bacterium]
MKKYDLNPEYIAVRIEPDDPFYDPAAVAYRVIERETGNCCGEPFDSLSAALKFVEQLRDDAEQDAENAQWVARVIDFPDVRCWLDRQAAQGCEIAWCQHIYFKSF